MMHTNVSPIDTQPSIADNCRNKSLNCLSASEFLNSRQLREAQGTRRVKWRGCLFLVLLLDKQKKNARCSESVHSDLINCRKKSLNCLERQRVFKLSTIDEKRRIPEGSSGAGVLFLVLLLDKQKKNDRSGTNLNENVSQARADAYISKNCCTTGICPFAITGAAGWPVLSLMPCSDLSFLRCNDLSLWSEMQPRGFLRNAQRYWQFVSRSAVLLAQNR